MTRQWWCALILTAVACCAHAGEEDEMMGFIVDDTISHIGHDFYYSFSERLRDTSPMDFNLVVRERTTNRLPNSRYRITGSVPRSCTTGF